MSFGTSSQESKSSSQLPEWYVPYAKESLKRGEQIANQGYTPYMGADVAAFNPQQISGMQGAADWNAAFNTPGQKAPSVAASLPKAQDFGNGMQGYSSYGGYMDQLENLKKTYPGMFSMIQAQAINPVTGRQGSFPPSAPGAGAGAASLFPAGPNAAPNAPTPNLPYDPNSREAQLFGTGGGGMDTGGDSGSPSTGLAEWLKKYWRPSGSTSVSNPSDLMATGGTGQGAFRPWYEGIR